MRVAAALALRDGDRKKLARIASSRAAEAGLARRARIVLLAAEGLPHTEVAKRAGVSVPVVRQWRSRYQAGGIGALEDLPRAGRPKTVDKTRIVVTTLEHPPKRLGSPLPGPSPPTHYWPKSTGKELLTQDTRVRGRRPGSINRGGPARLTETTRRFRASGGILLEPVTAESAGPRRRADCFGALGAGLPV